MHMKHRLSSSRSIVGDFSYPVLFGWQAGSERVKGRWPRHWPLFLLECELLTNLAYLYALLDFSHALLIK
jgi:hypothetical protein